MRSSNGWGRITVPGGRLELPGPAPIFYTAAFQQQAHRRRRRRRSTPSTSRRASSSTTRSAGTTGRSTSACWPATTRSTARACVKPSTLSGFVLAAAAPKYKMYEIPCKQDDAAARSARPGPTTARTRSTPATPRYNPAASSLPRAASWDRNLVATHQRLLRRQRRPDRHRPARLVVRQAVRRRTSTPRTIDEYLLGTVAAVQPATGRPALYGRYRSGNHFWEDTEQRRARLLAGRPRRPTCIPRELYIPNLTRSGSDRQIGRRAGLSGSSYVIAELDGAFTKYYEATLETEWRSGQDVRPRLLHLEPLLRQLRPGQLHRRRTTRTSSSARRTSATAPAASSGTTVRRPARRPPPPAQDLRLLRRCRWNATRRRLRRRPVRPAVGGVELRAVPARSPRAPATPPLRRAGRIAAHAPHWQLDLNYTQNFKLGGRSTSRSSGTCSTSRTARPATTSSRGPQLRVRQPRTYYDPRASSSHCASSSEPATPRHRSGWRHGGSSFPLPTSRTDSCSA